MAETYINFNGSLIPANQPAITVGNRSFKYGDGLFETMRWNGSSIRFLSYHLERLQEGMQLLQMEGGAKFDPYFVKESTLALVKKNRISGQARIRLNIFRDGAGYYSPETNKTQFVLETIPLAEERYQLNKAGVIIDVFNDHTKPKGPLAAIKSNNALLYVMAGLARKKRACDDMLLLNQDGFLCESISSNIFIWYDNALYTPAVSEGCVAGVMRRAVIELAKDNGIEVVEAQIRPEILHEADEMFLTNAIQGIHWVMGYKKKRYFNHLSKLLQEKLNRFLLDEDPQ